MDAKSNRRRDVKDQGLCRFSRRRGHMGGPSKSQVLSEW